MRTQVNKETRSRKRLPVKHKVSLKRVFVSITLATVGLVAYGYAYQYTHQAKLEKQYHQVQQEIEAKNKSLLQSSEQQKQLQDKLQQLEAELQAKKAEKLRLASLTQQRASAARVPVSGTCAEWIAAAGIGDVASAAELIRRESGCNPNAVNRSSGACGIGQSLPCSKMGPVNSDGTSAVSPVEQMIWMQNYVMRRYGSWGAAIAWHNTHNWY